ncbi:chemotaxis protein CheB [Spirillospora sp. NPDC048911]|uniref:chemotaxis protein CheB n=1 Tax=Spirillospora sp. NPDC048911 TaxID=3364527 RepID=UPI003710D5BC
MAARDLVVIGGSAGGVEALRGLVAGLPADLAAAVLVVMHTPASSTGRLARVVADAGRLPAALAVDRQPLRRGRIRVAVPDHHLLVGHMGDSGADRGTVVTRVARGPRVNRVRPAVDPLFRSAARWCGPRVIGVVLSGVLDDGAAGASAIAACGGTVLVQDAKEARFDGMPAAALAAVPDAVVGSAAELGRVVGELAGGRADDVMECPDDELVAEIEMMERGGPGPVEGPGPGTESGFGCPECGGGMKIITTGKSVHYRCHVGHAYSPQTLAAFKSETAEKALWSAASALQEKAAVHQRLAAGAAANGRAELQREHLRTGQEAATAAALILREFLAPE